MGFLRKYRYEMLFMAAAVVYLAGAVGIPVMDIDASLYAEMSREIFKSGNILTFLNREADLYLDKPPLIFWSAAGSYYLFGVNHFAYRLPTILSTILGAVSVFGFARLYYGRKEGFAASAMLITSQAWFLINHDVRTDTMLAHFVMFGTWQLALWLKSKRKYTFILAFTGFGMAVLAKGPVGLMAPIFAFAADFIIRKRWKNLFNPAWLLGLLIICLTISPMLYGLFRQYGPYGVEFTLWTQSFGRILGQNYWTDSSGPFFFVHTFLWSFLPWSFIAIAAIVQFTASMAKNGKPHKRPPEYMTYGGFIFTFIVLSFSSYKLPHYIYVVFPYAAVISGSFLVRIIESGSGWIKYLSPIQVFLAVFITLAIPALLIFFPAQGVFPWVLLAVIFIVTTSLLIRRSAWVRMFWLPAAAIIGANLFMNTHFYPQLLKYQPGKSVAEYVLNENVPVEKILLFNVHSSAMDFYMGATPPEVNLRKICRLAEREESIFVITDEHGIEQIRTEPGLTMEVLKSFDQYRVQILTLEFLNPKTRPGVTGKWHVVRISGSL